MASDDVIYGVLILFSVAFGHVIKITNDPTRKKILSTFIGLLMVTIVCGVDLCHSLLVAVVNALIVLYLHPNVCHIASFVWCFGYIVFFRTCHYYGLPQVAPHSNAVQLLLTLKMVGVAFEVHDSFRNRLRENRDTLSEDSLKSHYQNIKPTFTDIMCYAYCYIGLLTGPYYKYRTYHDMLHNDNTKNIDTWLPLWRRIKVIPMHLFIYQACSCFFSIEHVRQDVFQLHPFWFRLFYMVPMFVIFRHRLMVAWLGSECMCITAGLGAYPAASKPKCGQGPKDFAALKKCSEQAPEGIAYDFETIHNIDVYGCEFLPTVREGMRSWNMSVQFWLASNVYHRLPFKSSPIKVAVTMMVSAFWHGVHPGYYLSFIFIPVNLVAEDLMIAAFRNNRPYRQQIIFDWLCWFCKMRSFDYMCMGFLLLSYTDTVTYWASIYWAGHVFVVLFIVIGLVCRPRRKKELGAGDAPETAHIKTQ